MLDKQKISIIATVYNEEETVGQFHDVLTGILNSINYNHEIIYVNDGSVDQTLAVLKAIAHNNRQVKIISFSRNYGVMAALSAGLDHASGDAAITLDGDLQHPPELISKLLEKWQDGYDIVYTERDAVLKDSILRRLSTRLFYFVLKVLTNIDYNIYSSNYRLLSRKAIDAFKKFPERKRYVPGIVSLLGFKKTGVKFNVQLRKKGKSKFSLIKLLSLAFDGIFSFSNIPIRLITIIGAIMSLLSFLYLLSILIWNALHGQTTPGWTSIIVFIILLSGLQIIMMGILGEYIGRTYEENKQRPLYIIEEIIGAEQHAV